MMLMRWQVETGVPDSNLSPYKTQATSLIRLVTCPIYVASNTKKQIPDGVFLMGDIVSGRWYQWTGTGRRAGRQAAAPGRLPRESKQRTGSNRSTRRLCRS